MWAEDRLVCIWQSTSREEDSSQGGRVTEEAGAKEGDQHSGTFSGCIDQVCPKQAGQMVRHQADRS